MVQDLTAKDFCVPPLNRVSYLVHPGHECRPHSARDGRVAWRLFGYTYLPWRPMAAMTVIMPFQYTPDNFHGVLPCLLRVSTQILMTCYPTISGRQDKLSWHIIVPFLCISTNFDSVLPCLCLSKVWWHIALVCSLCLIIISVDTFCWGVIITVPFV